MTPDELFRRHHLLGLLGQDEARELLERVVVRTMAPGQTVFHRGDPGDGLYGVLSGRVVVTVESAAGKELILNMFGPGEFFGEIALLDGKGRTATAVSREPSTLMFLARRVFFPFIERRPQVAIRMIALLCERLRRTTQLFEDSTFLNVSARLAKQLVLLARQKGEAEPGARTAILAISQEELARTLGVSREIVSRQLGLWQEAGLVRLARGRITLCDSAELEQIVTGQ